MASDESAKQLVPRRCRRFWAQTLGLCPMATAKYERIRLAFAPRSRRLREGARLANCADWTHTVIVRSKYCPTLRSLDGVLPRPEGNLIVLTKHRTTTQIGVPRLCDQDIGENLLSEPHGVRKVRRGVGTLCDGGL